MLRFLRKYSSSVGVKILYGVLAGLFIVWGVGAIGGESADVAAHVRGETIMRRDVQRAAAGIQQRFEDLFHGRPPGTIDFQKQALDELIDDALVRHEAERLGVTVTDTELLETMRRMPELQDPDRLRALAANPRVGAGIQENVRRALQRQRVEGLVANGVAVSDAEIAERYRSDHDQIDLAFVRIGAADLAKDVTLTDQEVGDYLEHHADRYREPARVRVRYAAFRPADFAAQVTVKDGEIAEFYELHKDERFTTPEEVRARHIL